MDREIKLTETFQVHPDQMFRDWLSSKAHSAFTQSPAEIDPQTGGEFSAWDGYIFGKTLELEPGKRIRQTWRTTEFPAEAPDSLLEIFFEPEDKGTRLTLHHTRIPDGQAEEYEQGWWDFYFKPMKAFYKENK